MSTTSNFRRFASRRSLANLSIAQKQIAPTTTMLRTLIRTKRRLMSHLAVTTSRASNAHLAKADNAQTDLQSSPSAIPPHRVRRRSTRALPYCRRDEPRSYQNCKLNRQFPEACAEAPSADLLR